MGFSEKVRFFLDNIDHRFETIGWIFFTKTNIMCQILSRSDALKKKLEYPTLLNLSFC